MPIPFVTGNVPRIDAGAAKLEVMRRDLSQYLPMQFVGRGFRRSQANIKSSCWRFSPAWSRGEWIEAFLPATPGYRRKYSPIPLEQG